MGVLDMFSDVRTADTFDLDGGPDINYLDEGPPPVSRATGGSDLSCEVCGTPLEWAGRGRKPKYCADHRKGGGGPSSGVTGKSQLTDRRLKTIAGDLQYGMGQLAGTMTAGLPVTAALVVMRGPGAIDAFVKLAADYPRMLDGMEKAAKLVPWLEVGSFACAIGLAGAVDMGQANPYGMAGEYLGVAKAAQAIGWQPPRPKKTPEQAAQEATAPPAFKLVDGFTIRN